MNVAARIPEAVEALPLGRLRPLLTAASAYVVGGWVRELAAGREPGGDVDIAIEGRFDWSGAGIEDTGFEIHESHARFVTATIVAGDLRIDLAQARRESYAHPGALPEVEPAPIAEDLARRDFTVNALAVSLRAPDELLDPFDGLSDLRAGVLRVLHDSSFVDDPTRAIRAARYASRLRLEPEPATLTLLGDTDLNTVSADRRDTELVRLAAEAEAPRGFALLAGWGVLELGADALVLIAAIDELAAREPWAGNPSTRSRAILLAAQGGDRVETALRLASVQPERPSASVRLAAGYQDAELLVAAAAGADWIDASLRELQATALEISGEDLIAAGIPAGPAVGVALRGALERKLDGELSGGREPELKLALALARQALGTI